MTKEQKNNDSDWVDSLTELLGSFGFNKVKVRWKLEGFRKKLKIARFRAGEQAEHIQYKHKICAECGRLNDREATTCVKCGQRLGGHRWHMLERLGLSIPSFINVSTLLGIAMVVVYGRLLLEAGQGERILSFNVATLLRFGGNWSAATFLYGEYYRLGTAIFLHAGLWHLGFNLFALSQVGPHIEETFGRGRMLIFFMLTGLLASFGSALAGSPYVPDIWLFFSRSGGVSIGASGAIMGLIGLAAGWGHRDGTSIGKQIRSHMLKWCAYTLIFGIFIGADNIAHLVGFLTGGIIGLSVPPNAVKKSQRTSVRVIQTLIGSALALIFVVLCLFPLPSPANEVMNRSMRISRGQETVESLREPLCSALRDGNYDEAWSEARTDPEWFSYQEVRRRQLVRRYCELSDR